MSLTGMCPKCVHADSACMLTSFPMQAAVHMHDILQASWHACVCQAQDHSGPAVSRHTHAPVWASLPLVLLGFSKGAVVLNQVRIYHGGANATTRVICKRCPRSTAHVVSYCGLGPGLRPGDQRLHSRVKGGGGTYICCDIALCQVAMDAAAGPGAMHAA